MTATERLRAMLDERGVEWGANSTSRLLVTSWNDANGHSWAFTEYRDGSFSKLMAYHLNPEQAVAATLGPDYEPPIAARWDGDVLVLTMPRDPSSVHVQRAEGQPRKVYPAEATLGSGTCEIASSTLHEYEGGYAGIEWEHELSCGHTVWWDNDAPEWCPWCGAKVVSGDGED